MRARFATLGERWEMEERRRQAAQDGPELELQRELVRRKLELDRVQAGRLRAERELQIATARAAGFCHERDLLLNSTFWKLTYPARLLVGQAPRLSPAALLRGLRRRLRRHVPEAVVRHIPRPQPAAGEAPSRAMSPAPRPAVAYSLRVRGAAHAGACLSRGAPRRRRRRDGVRPSRSWTRTKSPPALVNWRART